MQGRSPDWAGWFPPGTLSRVDELTQLALAAGTGDRVATTAFVRRTQPEVWRVCARLGDRADRRRPHPGGVPAGASRRWRRSGASRRLAPGSSRSLATSAPTTSAAAPVAGRCSTGSCSARRAAASSAERTGELDLDDLIGRLDPDRREAFVLTQVAGLSYAEAAMVCEVPIGTIRSRVAASPGRPARRPHRRARRRLRVVGASSSASWTWPLVPTPLPPSIPSAAGEVGEPAPRLGEDHRHRTDVVGLDDRVDHRRRRDRWRPSA